MSPCTHPAAVLKIESVEQTPNGTTTVQFFCTSCNVPIIKQCLGHAPDPPSLPVASKHLQMA
jgi:hypothetical protein